MTATLVTFLGRTPKGENGYRTTVYTFPDGATTEAVAFLGWPLHRRLKADRLVILGTAGSMWDHLFEGDLDLGARAESDRLALVEAVERKQVAEAQLRRLAPLLEERLGCEVRLGLIPYCRDEAEQVTLLRILAGHIRRRETVHLDVTHGFRHLPMVALLAALYLRRLKDAEIAGIWYGAYDPDTGQAPVRELSGLLHLADWIEALAVYDHGGDYGVFAPLLGEAGKALARAAFHELTTNPVKAREALGGWQEWQEPIRGIPAFDLFRDALHRRLGWWRQGRRPQWEAGLARRYLDHGDHLRAVLYGLEAWVSAEVAARGGDVNHYDTREQVRKALQRQHERFHLLANLRNAMAHGVRPADRRVAGLMADGEKLATALRDLFRHLPEP